MLNLLKKRQISPSEILKKFEDSQTYLPADISGQSYTALEERFSNWTITHSDWENGKLEGTYEYCVYEYDGNALVHISPVEILPWKVDFSVEPVVIEPHRWMVSDLKM